jgi:hypothetical protein
VQGKPKHFIQIIKAHQYYDKHKHNFQISENTVPLTQLSGVLDSSLVFGYFLKGKKTWANWFN